MRARLVIAAVFLLAAATGILIQAPAHAASGFQYIGGYQGGVQVVNAWNGGPFVKVWNMAGSTNNDFTAGQNPFTGQGDFVIEFTGNGSWAGMCIGDAYNLPGHADVSLDPCATPGNQGGWGTNFTSGSSGCGNGQLWFHNNHWNGYLAGNGVGNPFYLNVGTKVCYSVLGAA